MDRNQPYVPRFQLRNMSGYAEDVEMMERPRQSFDSFASSESSYAFGRSRSLNYEYDRPNRVISGHRKLNRGFYTGPRNNFDSHANRIVAKLEQEKALMDDTPVSEQLRKEALRDLPQCLTMKRCVKQKLTKSVSQKSKRRPIGVWKRFKYGLSISFSKFVSNLKNFNYFQLWHSSLKDIEGHFGSGYASYFKFFRWLFVMNCIVAVISFSMLVVPQIIHDTSGSDRTVDTFEFKDIFTGIGFFNSTIFYYGHYTDNVIEAIPHLLYDMPAAYFATIVFLYLISFIVLAVSVAESYRRTFIVTEGGLQNVYANRILCGWDYTIATKEAADLKSSAIYNELKELLSEEHEDREDQTCLYKFWTFTIQIIVNILVFVILGAVGWTTWLLLDFANSRQDDTIILPAVTISLVMMTFPTIFHYIAEYEDYENPRTALYITLTRTYLLGAVIIGNILSFWLTRAGNTDCWEDQIGAELYRLIIFDFLFSVILTAILDVGYFVGRYFSGWDPKSEFNIAQHTLQIIFNQGLFWTGFLYSPVLPMLVTLKMFVMWYVRKGCVRKFCKPPRKIWRAAQAQTWFMMMIFISILLVIAAHGYTIKSVGASSSCGPFKNHSYIYEIVTDGFQSLEQEGEFWRVIMNVTKPGGIAFIMIALMILTYYIREQAVANKEKVKMLREMLVWAAKDKKFLVHWYNDLTKGQLDDNFHDGYFDPTRVQPQEYVTTDYSSSVDDEELNARFRQIS